jgi:hypothetical protein
MIVIGADTHKRSHALAALDSQTGVLIDELEIGADGDGHLRAMAWAAEPDRRVAGRMVRRLASAGWFH